MERIKVTIRGVEASTWDVVMRYRDDEQVLVGAIINEALSEYFDLSEPDSKVHST
jgi:hypothetical protein